MIFVAEREKCYEQTKNEWGRKILFSHGSSNSRGVVIVIPNGSIIAVSGVPRDDYDYGRILIVLTNMYAPNIWPVVLTNLYIDLKNIFLDNNFESKENIIIGGDFNCILNANLDKKGGIAKLKDNVVNNINALIDIFDFWA